MILCCEMILQGEGVWGREGMRRDLLFTMIRLSTLCCLCRLHNIMQEKAQQRRVVDRYFRSAKHGDIHRESRLHTS